MRSTNEPALSGDSLGPVNTDPRVQLAAERTLLAWVRTGLAMMGFGFVVARFGLFLRELAAMGGDRNAPSGHGGSLIMGVGLVGIGVWVLAAAAIRYRRYYAALDAGKVDAPPGPLFGLAVAAALALLGIFMTFYLLIFG